MSITDSWKNKIETDRSSGRPLLSGLNDTDHEWGSERLFHPRKTRRTGTSRSSSCRDSGRVVLIAITKLEIDRQIRSIPRSSSRRNSGRDVLLAQQKIETDTAAQGL